MPRSTRVKKEPDEEPAVTSATDSDYASGNTISTTRTRTVDADHPHETPDEEADEVVREIEVFLSPALQLQLHLIQFPLQHHHVPLPDAARVRPRHGMLELDQRIPPNAGTDGGYDLTHRTHVSHTIPVSTHMALGKFEYSSNATTAALHLIPLSHITQMRPTFDHVNDGDTTTAPTSVSAAVSEEEGEDQSKRRPLMFQKKETERAAMARKSSYAYKRNSEESEEWQELSVQDRESLAYRQVQANITCPAPNNELVRLESATSNQGDADGSFVHSLNYLPDADPETTGHEVFDVDQPMPSASVGEVADHPTGPFSSTLVQISIKLTELLHRGWPVPYSVIRAQFPSSVDDVDIVSALSSCAVLVRGNFVLQSRLLSLPSTTMTQVRTFLLYLLQTFGYVQRNRLDYAYREDVAVTSEALFVLLEQVAIKVTNGWKLKVEDDVEFPDRFPEQAQLHAQYWERQATRFAEYAKDYTAAPVS